MAYFDYCLAQFETNYITFPLPHWYTLAHAALSWNLGHWQEHMTRNAAMHVKVGIRDARNLIQLIQPLPNLAVGEAAGQFQLFCPLWSTVPSIVLTHESGPSATTASSKAWQTHMRALAMVRL